MLGPRVQLYTVNHPLNPVLRRNGAYGQSFDITIGDDVWVGGGAIICPGVSLGNNVIVGAGSVVTKSFGDNVVIAGNPARVIKKVLCQSVRMKRFWRTRLSYFGFWSSSLF